MNRPKLQSYVRRSVLLVGISTIIQLFWAEIVVSAEGALPVNVPTPALFSDAATELGITQIEEAGMALIRPFDDPIELTLRAELSPRKQTPLHCRALLDVETYISGTTSVSDWELLQLRLADCHALQWLNRSQSPIRTALPANVFDLRETRFWPAEIWPAISQDELKYLARLSGQTLQHVSGEQFWKVKYPKSKRKMELRLNAKNYKVNIKGLAHGDFDGDGWEDWLLRVQAKAIGGSWRAYRCMLLTRHTQMGLLSITDANE